MTRRSLDEPSHAAAGGRLRTEPIIWLTTVNPAARPQTTPLWFLWRDGQFPIYGGRRRPKTRNIEGALPAEEESAVSDRYRTISYALLRKQGFLSPALEWSDVAPRRLDLHAFIGEVHGVPRRANLALPVHLARP